MFCSLLNLEVFCQNLVSRAGTNNYIPQILWDVITCPCSWYSLLVHHFSLVTPHNTTHFYHYDARWLLDTKQFPMIILMTHRQCRFNFQPFHLQSIAHFTHTWARFLSLARSKLRLCLANHRAGFFSNLACDWLSIVWAYSEQETENGPWMC